MFALLVDEGSHFMMNETKIFKENIEENE